MTVNDGSRSCRLHVWVNVLRRSVSQVGNRWQHQRCRCRYLFAKALFNATELVQSISELFNAYSMVCHHRSVQEQTTILYRKLTPRAISLPKSI